MSEVFEQKEFAESYSNTYQILEKVVSEINKIEDLVWFLSFLGMIVDNWGTAHSIPPEEMNEALSQLVEVHQQVNEILGPM